MPIFLAHAPFADHPDGNGSSHFDVAARAICDVADTISSETRPAHAGRKTSQGSFFLRLVYLSSSGNQIAIPTKARAE